MLSPEEIAQKVSSMVIRESGGSSAPIQDYKDVLEAVIDTLQTDLECANESS